MAQFNETATYTGLRTSTVNIPEAGSYNFQGTLTLPTAHETGTQGPGGGAGTGTGSLPTTSSQVIVTIKQNGSTIFTTNAGAKGFCLRSVQCAASDVMTFQTSSSAYQDKDQANLVSLTLATSEGPI